MSSPKTINKRERPSSQFIDLALTCKSSRLFTGTKTLTVERNQTWLQLLTDRLGIDIPPNRNIFITSKTRHDKRWSSPLTDKISKSLTNFKRTLPKYSVVIWNEPSRVPEQNFENPTSENFQPKLSLFILYENPRMTAPHEAEEELHFEWIEFDANAKTKAMAKLNELVADRLFLRARSEFRVKFKANPNIWRYCMSHVPSLCLFPDEMFPVEEDA